MSIAKIIILIIVILLICCLYLANEKYQETPRNQNKPKQETQIPQEQKKEEKVQSERSVSLLAIIIIVICSLVGVLLFIFGMRYLWKNKVISQALGRQNKYMEEINWMG